MTKKKSVKKPAKRSKRKSAGGTSSRGEQLSLALPGLVTPISLQLPARLSYSDWVPLGAKICRAREFTNWAIGDWLNYGETHYGEMYAQGASEIGQISEDTLLILKLVAARLPFETRIEELSWSHHRLVAPVKFTPKDQAHWLGLAVKNNWSVKELADAIKAKDKLEEEEPEEEETEKEGKGCETCGADGAPMKVCGSCASVAAKAVETVGVKGAIDLMRRNPSKPQRDMLEWALRYVKQPSSQSPDEEMEWEARYEALRKTVEKGKPREQVAA